MTSVTFYTDTATLQFIDGPNGEKLSWVHALPGGDWKHPVYGDLKFDDNKINNYVTSVTQKYRQVDPDIDYDHKQDAAMGNRAAGWVKDAKAELNSAGTNQDLWLLVEWTPPGYQAIKNKEYRYFSSELADEWTDQSGKTYKDVVFGGGITNRPYMKNLVPLNLSELTFTGPTPSPAPTPPAPEPPTNNLGDQVDPKELRRKLGLSEDASDAAVDAKLSEVAKLGTPPTITNPTNPTNPQFNDDLAKLAETNPVIKAFMDQMAENTKALKEANERAQLAETQNKLRSLCDPTSKFSFSAAQLNEATALMIGAPQALSDKLFSLLSSIVTDGLTMLGEMGNGDGGPSRQSDKAGQSGNAETRFNEAVDKAVKDSNNKLSYPDAMEQVARQDPQLYADYRKAVYIPADA